MEEEREVDLDEFIDHVFESNPKGRKSIAFQMDVDDYDMQEHLRTLTKIFIEGMKILYGDENNQVNLDRLEERDFEYVNEYFESFYYNLLFEKINRNTNETEFKNINDDRMDEQAGEDEQSLFKNFFRINTQSSEYRFYFVPLRD